MTDPADPVHPADAQARALARTLVQNARTAGLSFLHPQNGAPFISRIAIGTGPQGELTALLSGIALHSHALKIAPAAALLIGEVGPKGNPLTSPRLALQVVAQILARDDNQHPLRREAWLKSHTKAALYIDFADFFFVRFRISGGILNGGFGKAFYIGPSDLDAD